MLMDKDLREKKISKLDVIEYENFQRNTGQRAIIINILLEHGGSFLFLE